MRRNPRRTESSWVFAAAKKMARRHVKQPVQKFRTNVRSLATWGNGPEVPMHACSSVSPDVGE